MQLEIFQYNPTLLFLTSAVNTDAVLCSEILLFAHVFAVCLSAEPHNNIFHRCEW